MWYAKESFISEGSFFMARKISILLLVVLVAVACFAKFQENGQASFVQSKDLAILGGALAVYVLLTVLGRHLRKGR